MTHGSYDFTIMLQGPSSSRQTGEANWQYLTHSTDEEDRLWVAFTAYNTFDYREIGLEN